MNDLHPNHPDYVQHDKQTGEVDEDVMVEVLDPISIGALATLQRVEIDQQVATAKQYPRNVPRIKQELTALVTMDEDTADDCIYALPRGTKHIKGPSARFADALISFWGNARSGAFITQVNREEKFVEAIGSFQDVERNVIRQRRVRRPIAGRDGRVYNNDMINMTGNAACVIAERNAILNGIPKSLWSGAYEQAFALVAGTVKTLDEKLKRAEKHFMAMGISMDQVLEKLERPDVSKIIPDDIVTMRGMLTALKTGEETVETIFGRGAGANHEHVKNPLKDDPGVKVDAAGTVQQGHHRVAAAAALGLGPKPGASDHEVDSGAKSSANPPKDKGNAGADHPKEASTNRPDPISSGTATRQRRGVPRLIDTANTVIDISGRVTKTKMGEIEVPIVDQRFDEADQLFESLAEWEAATADMAEPEFEDQKEPETATTETEKTNVASEVAGKPAEAASKDPAPDTAPAKNNAQPATAPKTDRPYDDDKTYMAFMRDQLDLAKGKAQVTNIWGSTRADRNELLSADQIEELTKDKEAKLVGLKLKEGK